MQLASETAKNNLVAHLEFTQTSLSFASHLTTNKFFAMKSLIISKLLPPPHCGRTSSRLIVALFSLLLISNVANAQVSQPSPTASSSDEPSDAADKPELFGCGTDNASEFKDEENPKSHATGLSTHASPTSVKRTEYTPAAASKTNPSSPTIIYIPVVVHLIQDTYAGYEGSATITTTQVQDQIDALNRDFMATNYDYSKLKNTYFSAMYGQTNARIQFCLARRDINNRPLNGTGSNPYTVRDPGEPVIAGVERVGALFSSYNYQIGGTVDNPRAVLPSFPNWPPSDYLNIWVCALDDTYSAIAGVSNFPSPPVLGTNQDGVVMHTTYFGVDGHGRGPLRAHLGHTLSHEVGHWLNLRHLWGQYATNSQCLYDDAVADTPKQDGPSQDELAYINGGRCPNPAFPLQTPVTCSNGRQGGNMYMSFMDYTPEGCWYMFSPGQADRMRQTVLSPNAPRASLLNSLGMAPQSVDIDNFGATTALCVGSRNRFAVEALFLGGPPCSGELHYQWTVPTGWSINLATNATPTITPNGTNGGSVGLTITYQNGTGSVTLIAPPLVFTLTTAPVPVFTTTGDVCPGGTRTFAVRPVPGATSYTWQVPAGFTIAGAASGATTYTVNSTSIDVTAVAPSGGASSTVNYTVGVNTNLAGACATTPNATTSFHMLSAVAEITTNPVVYLNRTFSPPVSELCANTRPTAEVHLIGCTQGTNSNFTWTLGLDTYLQGDYPPQILPGFIYSNPSQFSTGNSGHNLTLRVEFDNSVSGHYVATLPFTTAHIVNGYACPPDVYSRPTLAPPTLYPNPATGLVSAERLTGTLRLYSSQGRLVYEMPAQPVGQPTIFDVHGLPAGLYELTGKDATGRPVRQQLQVQP